MGADFIHAHCPLPDLRPEGLEDLKKKINLRVSNLRENIVEDILENFHHDWQEDVKSRIDEKFGEEHLFELDNIRSFFKKEIATELVNESLDEIIWNGSRRDIGNMFLEHRWWIISGGMSWGDSPTEAMRYIDILEASHVLEGLNPSCSD